ncbi:TPA: hypothetical protein PXP39_001791 [Yersinia enterocolitica]|nr:hypothetical protein [Yersinia enterocolitica]HDL7831931.1 hypothetical protein [Yersinia enterocolitica]HDL7872595.1 hypothetical protein [Yersinia enterocolitica]HDL7885438.1 hypothetical protein [Yersinia enterocolitica]HDL7893903.1 hypothetical protein [Yersinia enterocolitica]
MVENFGNYRLNFIYLHEVWWIAKSIKEQCELLFSKTPIPENETRLQVDYTIHNMINNLLSDSANLKKLIFEPKNKSKSETVKQFKLHITRCKYIQNEIKGIEISELKSVSVRNSLQHFDEYLDEFNLNVTEGKQNVYSLVLYNITTSSWAPFEKTRVAPLRLYVSSERKFYNMKNSIDIGKIYSEVTAIYKLLDGKLHTPESPPGAFIFSL